MLYSKRLMFVFALVLSLAITGISIPTAKAGGDICYTITLKVTVDGNYDTYVYSGRHRNSQEATNAAISAAKSVYKCYNPTNDCQFEVISQASDSHDC